MEADKDCEMKKWMTGEGVMDFANRVDSVWIRLSECNVRGDHIAILQLPAKLFSNTSQYLCFKMLILSKSACTFFFLTSFIIFWHTVNQRISWDIMS